MMVRSILVASCLAAVSSASQAAAPTPPPVDSSLEGREISGTVGGARIGAYFVIRDHTQFVRGHYFYVSHLIDIPLTGQVDGEDVTLREPGGGVFHLRPFANGSVTGPLTFYNSVGLVGTWTRGSQTLPATLNFEGSRSVGRPFYADVTDQPDAVFETMVKRFLHAVETGDRKTAAGLVSYPLRWNGARSTIIRNHAQFLSAWNAIFTPRYVGLLKTAVPHEMFVRDGYAMVGSGEVWFDAKGAVTLNVPH